MAKGFLSALKGVDAFGKVSTCTLKEDGGCAF